MEALTISPLLFFKKLRGSLFHKKRGINQKCNGQIDIGMDKTKTVYPTQYAGDINTDCSITCIE